MEEGRRKKEEAVLKHVHGIKSFLGEYLQESKPKEKLFCEYNQKTVQEDLGLYQSPPD